MPLTAGPNLGAMPDEARARPAPEARAGPGFGGLSMPFPWPVEATHTARVNPAFATVLPVQLRPGREVG